MTQSIVTEELLPCPFCGEPAEVDMSRGFRALRAATMHSGVAIYCSAYCHVELMLSRVDFPEYDEDQLLAILTENWNRRASKPADGWKTTPDHVYDPDDWEYSMPWEDRNELVEAWPTNKPHRVATLIDGPTKWAVILWDEENGEEIRWFDSEEEAKAVLPAPPSSIPGDEE